jgi:hypothetical protein
MKTEFNYYPQFCERQWESEQWSWLCFSAWWLLDEAQLCTAGTIWLFQLWSTRYLIRCYLKIWLREFQQCTFLCVKCAVHVLSGVTSWTSQLCPAWGCGSTRLDTLPARSSSVATSVIRLTVWYLVLCSGNCSFLSNAPKIQDWWRAEMSFQVLLKGERHTDKDRERQGTSWHEFCYNILLYLVHFVINSGRYLIYKISFILSMQKGQAGSVGFVWWDQQFQVSTVRIITCPFFLQWLFQFN